VIYLDLLVEEVFRPCNLNLNLKDSSKPRYVSYHVPLNSVQLYVKLFRKVDPLDSGHFISLILLVSLRISLEGKHKCPLRPQRSCLLYLVFSDSRVSWAAYLMRHFNRTKLIQTQLREIRLQCFDAPFDVFPTRCKIIQFIYFWKSALHVSGGISTHQQERTQLYLQYLVRVKPLLLPAAVAEGLKLV